MRIALVVRGLLDLGGAQRQARLLAGELARRGHAVAFITERVPGLHAPAYLDGIPVHAICSVPVPGLRSLVYMAGLAWHLVTRGGAYDVVHVFFFKHSAVAAVLAGALTRRPVVVRPACAGPFGDLAPLARRPLWRAVMRLGCRADAFVALTEELAGELAAFGCPPERVHRIPSGVPVPAVGTSPGGCPPTVLFAGRLHPQKGLPVLLRAWRRVLAHGIPGGTALRKATAGEAAAPAPACEPLRGVAEDYGDARLVLLGEGPERSALEALARDLGLGPSVTFAGAVDDVPDRLACARAFVLPSLGEGMNSALLEAMAAGRAVVATRLAGSAELITHGETGLLVDAGDEAGLAGALACLIADRHLADALGRRARQLVCRRFTVQRLTRAHLALYARLMRDP